MKTLFINAPNVPFTEKSILIEPIDLLALATYAKSLGHEVKIIDMDVKRLTCKDLNFKILNPDYVIMLFDYHLPLHTNEAIKVINKISNHAKDSGAKVIIAGKTPKHYPSIFNADIIINSEAEYALKEILEAKKLSEIKGITYQEKGKIITTKERTEKIDLNSLPIPKRDLLDINDYIDVRTILSSRGCNNCCNFCATPSFWGKWRARSAKNVIDEVELLVKQYNAKKILFIDDNAIIDNKRMIKISKELIKRAIKVSLGCLGSINYYNKSMIKIMHKAGFRWIHYGAESACSSALTKSHKGITPLNIRKAINESRRIGLRVRTSWIMDLPGMDKQGLIDTINLILDCEPEELRMHYLTLRVGSEFEQGIKNGKIPSQYIHQKKSINNPMKIFLKKLEKKGYKIIDKISDWNKALPKKFISFCPARYGINWEAE